MVYRVRDPVLHVIDVILPTFSFLLLNNFQPYYLRYFNLKLHLFFYS